MNVPVDWPETVVVSTRDLVKIMRFLTEIDMDVFFTDDAPAKIRATADDMLHGWNNFVEVLDAKCPGWE